MSDFKRTRLPTPDAPPVLEYRQVLLTVPSNADVERIIRGALLSLCYWTSWDEVGTMSAADTAQMMKVMLDSWREFNMIGSVIAFYTEDLPNLTLLCDGSVYNREDYPQLWEVLPSAAKTSTTFTTPDLRSKFLLGASLDYLAGSVGGEAEVTLSELEMPSHTHGYFTPTFNIDVESVGIPDPTGVGNPQLPATTQATGGGQPHNNMPPYFAMRLAIVAGVAP